MGAGEGFMAGATLTTVGKQGLVNSTLATGEVTTLVFVVIVFVGGEIPLELLLLGEFFLQLTLPW